MCRCQAEASGLPPASHSEGRAAGTGSTSSVNQVSFIYFLVHPRSMLSHRCTSFSVSFILSLCPHILQQQNLLYVDVPPIPCFSSFILVPPCSSVFILVQPNSSSSCLTETKPSSKYLFLLVLTFLFLFTLVHPFSFPNHPLFFLFLSQLILANPQQRSETRACSTWTFLQVRARRQTPSGALSSRRASRCDLAR